MSYINNIALNRMTIHGTGTGIIVKLRDHVYKTACSAHLESSGETAGLVEHQDAGGCHDD